tara:strand:+ start:996 stop:1457 length:462 start_codon:yes stop_codon:yes gene_type:complete
MKKSKMRLLTGLIFVIIPLTIVSGTVSGSDQGVVMIDGRSWTNTSNGVPVKWPDADKFCSELDINGKRDWVVPTLSQLWSLYDKDTATGVRGPIKISSCCVWSSDSLEDLAASDADEIAGEPGMYRWGLMFDGGLEYYAVHIFEDGEVLCTQE